MHNLLEELVTNPTQSKDHSDLNIIADIFKNKFGIVDTSLSIVKKYISKLISSLKGAINTIINLINYTITTIINVVKYIFNIPQSNATTQVGGKSAGFWTFWGVTGALLIKMCLKIYNFFRTKNEQCLTTELISNQTLILNETEEPNFVVTKVIKNGVASMKELYNQISDDTKSKIKTFLTIFAGWVLGVFCCALFVMLKLDTVLLNIDTAPEVLLGWLRRYIEWRTGTKIS